MSVAETQGKQASNVGGCTVNMHCIQARVYMQLHPWFSYADMHALGREVQGRESEAAYQEARRGGKASTII